MGDGDVCHRRPDAGPNRLMPHDRPGNPEPENRNPPVTPPGMVSPTGSREASGPAVVTDEALVRAYQAAPASKEGQAAAERLFGRYHERVYFWCLRLARDHHRAQDLAQEALLVAIRDLGQFQGRSQFSTWLYTVVRRRCIRLLRRERILVDDSVDPDAIEAPAADPATRVGSEEEERWLRRKAIEILDPMEATALFLRCDEGLSVDEITRLLAVPGASGARGLLQAARRHLRAALEERP